MRGGTVLVISGGDTARKKTVSEGVAVYRKFYTAADEKLHGVLAIHVMLVK